MNKDDLKIVFLSRTVPNLYKEEIYNKQKNTMQSAAISFQEKIIRGIEKNIEKTISLFNLMPIYSYPKYYKDWFIKSSSFSHGTDAIDYNVGFINLAYIKQIMLPNAYLRQFKKYIKSNSCNTLICYTPELVLLRAIKWAKRKYPQIKNCVIIPDMPEFTNLSSNQSLIRKIYNKYTVIRVKKMIKYIDSYVYLTEQSADYFCNNKPYIVIEGIANLSMNDEFDDGKWSNEKYILYTGTTNAKFGIINLLKAFEIIKDRDLKLVICGCGDSDQIIEEYSKEDSRIIFMGNLPQDEVRVLQKYATVLVNPRQNIGEYTKYSFPSKNMEYLVSGIPVVAYKLDGIPDEYDSYIIYVEDNSIKCLADTLLRVSKWDEDLKKSYGEKARNFVLKYKNESVQTLKIVEMLKKI